MADGKEATEIFVNAWAAYQKLLDNDYLSHKILYGGLTDALRSLKGGERFALLDMGCGDAHYIASALKASNSGKRLSRYTGVDLAGDALKLAERNISDVTNGNGCQLDVFQANMLEYTAAKDAQPEFDAALTSFAAHHLRTEEKEESLQSYMDRFCQWAADNWTTLTSAELRHFEDHMRSYDIQEPVDKYQEFATKAGFGQAEEVTSDGNFMKVLAFTKEERHKSNAGTREYSHSP